MVILMTPIESVREYFEESIAAKQATLQDPTILSKVGEAIECLAKAYARGHKVLIAGNGGSAADSQHFAAELVCRFKRERKGRPAIALTTDTSILTAWSNDYDFESVFARQIDALGVHGDVFIGISTSGNSKNIIRAVEKAKAEGMTTICLLGCGGGKLRGMSDIDIIVPSSNTPRIQEVHTLLVHSICEEVEKTFS